MKDEKKFIKCVECGQTVEVVEGTYTDKEGLHTVGKHIIGHFRPITYHNRVPRYRMCKGSGRVPNWSIEKKQYVNESVPV